MKSNQQVRQGRVKLFAVVIGGSAVVLFAVVIGGSAVVALGALSVALHEEQASGASGGVATGATFIQGGGMTLGQTATTTTPPAAPATSFAVPPVKAKP